MNMHRSIARTSLFCALLVALAACGGDEASGTGELIIMAYAEEFVEEGTVTDDGWALTFDGLGVRFEEITLGGLTINPDFIIELAEPSGGTGHSLVSERAFAGTFEGASYVISEVRIRGSATKEGQTKTFDWTFEERTRYFDCENETVIPKGGKGMLELTIHADHFFFDSLVGSDPQVLFQALADADTGEGNNITPTHLAAADIGSYDPGNESIDNLWDWLSAQVRTLGHIDGEGHCAFEALP